MTITLFPPAPTEFHPVISDRGEPLALPAASVGLDGTPRYTMWIPAAELDQDLGRDRFARELDGGIDAEIRLFLDEQLLDGDVVVDVDAGWGAVALDAATAARRRIRVLAAVARREQWKALNRAAREAATTGTMEVVMLDELARHLALTTEPRIFVRASAADHLLQIFPELEAMTHAEQLAAVIWRCDAPRSDAALRGRLTSSGYQLFQFAIVEHTPQLFPLGNSEAAEVVFALSGTYLSDLAEPAEPATPVELRAAHEILTVGPSVEAAPPAPALDLNLSVPTGSAEHGQVAWDLVQELERAGHRVALFGGVEAVAPRPELLLRAMDRQASFADFAPSVRIAPAEDLAQHVGRGARVGFPEIALTHFSARERHHLNTQDQLLVSSRWAKAVLEANGIRTPVAVVPLGVNREVFNERVDGDLLTVTGRPTLVHEASLDVGKGDAVRLDIWQERPSTYHARERETVFLSVGPLSTRKGQEFLLTAFENAFSPEDNVRLVFACHNPALAPARVQAWEFRVSCSPVLQKITLLQGPLPDPHWTARLMASADCGVFPSRAEGWNAELLQMMSLGREVIATAYGGHTEVVSARSARVICIDALEPAGEGPAHALWAELGGRQMEQLVEHLREVHRLKSAGALRVNQAGIAVAQAFSWRNSALTLAGHLASLTF